MKALLAGLDAGSTTVKLVLTDETGVLRYQRYERHQAKIRETTLTLLEEAAARFPEASFRLAVTGSAGLGLAKAMDLPFVQEVHVAAQAVQRWLPGTDVVVELGGEDAKIIFLTGGLDQRMNGSCAGGTGAFIDQMATLLDVAPDELDHLAAGSTRTYPIASRCGVFAKSDIQPLINQGAAREDIAASIFQAVVNQTVTGLAQGRRIAGNVAFLGGPLTFFKSLGQAFVNTLHLTREQARFPENAAFFVAMGAALAAADHPEMPAAQWVRRFAEAEEITSLTHPLPPLFKDEAELAAFRARHAAADTAYTDIQGYRGDAWLGIDCGSTTTKLVLLDTDGGILFSHYGSNKGNPLGMVHQKLKELRALCGDRIRIRGSAVTGYGEDLMKNACSLDLGLVETVAHARAARHFQPDVDFILDIGGQDIKCFHLRQGAVDSIMLNEACSSGCGSFIETYARALGHDAASFAALALQSRTPVDLGTRCTVFMNSSIKQAQKEGAQLSDISAGLAVSVVKNALYKVIRVNHADQLGRHVVVQGGTFYNDAVLRAFEKELGTRVVRPGIAGLMGAYGAALSVMDNPPAQPRLVSLAELEAFSFQSRETRCGLCGNNCRMTITTFANGRRHFTGNRCSRPLREKDDPGLPNLFREKYEWLRQYGTGPDSGTGTATASGSGTGAGAGPATASGSGTGAATQHRGRIGLPMVLNMFENLPFWHTLFSACGFEVVLSDPSSREMYAEGQHTIPSDTVCYPAKLSHGHIENLLAKGLDAIFYPCLPYNFKETEMADNHYNCPVVAYYPELLAANAPALADIRYLTPYFGLHRPKDFTRKAVVWFKETFGVPAKVTRAAITRAYAAYEDFLAHMRARGEQALAWARENGRRVAILAGRPYHVDPEVSHGIDRLLSSLGLVVVTEDAVAHLGKPAPVKVLNQWMYHSRLYNAARYAAEHDDCALVQLVSFGCGLDAITTDEVRAIVEASGKLYTQLKIDDIDNLGAVKIRIRSLLAAWDARQARRVLPQDATMDARVPVPALEGRP
jgi:predicted CoA-substrate-specific enzyme activase